MKTFRDEWRVKYSQLWLGYMILFLIYFSLMRGVQILSKLVLEAVILVYRQRDCGQRVHSGHFQIKQFMTNAANLNSNIWTWIWCEICVGNKSLFQIPDCKKTYWNFFKVLPAKFAIWLACEQRDKLLNNGPYIGCCDRRRSPIGGLASLTDETCQN